MSSPTTRLAGQIRMLTRVIILHGNSAMTVTDRASEVVLSPTSPPPLRRAKLRKKAVAIGIALAAAGDYGNRLHVEPPPD